MNDIIFGPVTVILLMAAATFLCRTLGFWIIGYMPIGRRMRRAFEALPGCIAAASALPVALDAGPVAMIALVLGFAVMRIARIEIAALVAALGLVALTRAAGF